MYYVPFVDSPIGDTMMSKIHTVLSVMAMKEEV